MNKIVIHQPNLFPRLKVLHKIALAEMWVVFDDVQYVQREWQNRTKLRFYNSPHQEFWLTIPVHCSEGRRTLIQNVIINNPDRIYEKFYKSLVFTYGKSNYWGWINQYINLCYENIEEKYLSNFCTKSMLLCFDMLGIKIETILSSQLGIHGKSTDKIAKICSYLGSNVYISGTGGANYLDLNIMKSANIEVEWQNWVEPNLKFSKYGHLSWRNYSFLDFLAHFGPDATRDHILKVIL